MKKRIAGCTVWMLLASLLYFFENNTGTRIVLLCSLLLPWIPVLRKALLSPDETGGRPRAAARTKKEAARREEDDPGDVRIYLPGDPVNRIHWKLSAKRGQLLVRERVQEAEEIERKQLMAVETPAAKRPGKKLIFIGWLFFFLCLLLLFSLPPANRGMQALMNRLYDASEAVNAYVYQRFDVPEGQPVTLAGLLFAGMLISLLILAAFSRSRWPGLGLAAGCVFFQVYFGLSFPLWLHLAVLAAFSLWAVRRPWKRETALALGAGILAVSLAVALLFPGVDAAVEAASETVRDRLSSRAQQITGVFLEQPAEENETRHVFTQSLTAGGQEARPDREYQLVTVEEEQISMPHWVSYLRIILLLLLSAAVVILPFLPFWLLNRRRKKALDARKAFQSENVSEAVLAIFRHVTAWLEATGNGNGSLPYAQWRAEITPGYGQRFSACEKLFEEAAYSTHSMGEKQRQQMLALLSETEQALRQKADWKQKLRLKYKENLWI